MIYSDETIKQLFEKLMSGRNVDHGDDGDVFTPVLEVRSRHGITKILRTPIDLRDWIREDFSLYDMSEYELLNGVYR